MKVLNSEQMRRADNIAIKEIGIPGVVLMENAGRQVVESIESFLMPEYPLKIAVFCGRGNNGGDGFVVARHLHNRGHNPEVFLLGSKEEIKGDAKINMSIALKMGLKIDEIAARQGWEKQIPCLSDFDLIIDAIFGTGLTLPVKDFYADIINYINKSEVIVASVDLPSGLSADTGTIIGPSITADITVTFAYPKLALVLPPAEEKAGKIVVADIGMPPEIVENQDEITEFIDEELAYNLLPMRKADSHKGDYGHLLVIAGSIGKTGAASMTGEAALRTGAGLITVATAASLNPILENKLTEVMTEPLAETPHQTISLKALDKVLELAQKMDAMALGPGLSQNRETQKFVQELIKQTTIPLILDADGINAFASCPQLLKGDSRALIVSPHPGEMARLIDCNAKEVQQDRLGICRRFAQEHSIYVVLKGYRTVISTPEGKLFINGSGNPGMASGGTGDILTGMLGGFLVQKINIIDALILGVYMHGLAGDLASDSVGAYSLAATDLLEFLPDAFNYIEQLDVEEENNYSI
jgi:NAD(P)H-hydrate epimerase